MKHRRHIADHRFGRFDNPDTRDRGLSFVEVVVIITAIAVVYILIGR